MSSVAETQPRTGRRNFTLRAYLAGTAATAALLGAVVLVFASLGAYVAFNGLPIGGGQASSDAASVKVGPPAQAAQAKQVHRQQVANAAVHRQAANAATGSGSHAANGGSHTGATSSDSGQAVVTPATPAAPTGTSTATVTANGSGSTAPANPTQGSAPTGGGSTTLPSPQVTTPEAVGSTLGTVEQTLHQAGVNVPLSDPGSTLHQGTDGLLGGGGN